MAKKEIALEIKIEAANSAKTLGEMKSSLKALVAEQQNVARGTKDWDRLSKAINDAEGKIGDLTDSFSTLKGSGIERASSSLSLLREGITNLDFEKVKIGLGGVKAALAATGIMLFVQGITALIQNFDELKESGGVIGTVFTKIGEGIDWVLEKLEVFGDWIGLIDKELNDMSEAIDTNAEKNKEALDATTAAYDRQIKVAQSAGKSTVELEKAKQQAIIDTNLAVVKQIEAFVRAGGELDEQKKKLLTASLESIRNAKTEEIVISNKAEQDKAKQSAEINKAAQEKRKAQAAQDEKDYYAALDQIADTQKENDKLIADEAALQKKAQRDLEQQEFDQFIAQQKALKDADSLADLTREQQAYADKLLLHQQWEASKQQISEAGLNAAKGLTEAFFAFQLNGAKGNAEKELQIKKRMFEVDKAFSVARAIQDGIRSVNGALAQTATLGPYASVLAGINAALAAANVAKILATKFDAGSAGGGSISAPNIPTSGSGTNTVPTINNAANSAPIQATSFNEDGSNKSMVVKAIVVETDITDSQRRISKIERMSEF
jgi:hypothetical protein